MIIVLKNNCAPQKVEEFSQKLTDQYGVKVNTWHGTQSTVLGLIGDTSVIDIDYIQAQDIVEEVKRVQDHIKRQTANFIRITRLLPCQADRQLAEENLPIIAGPCSVESRDQIVEIAKRVKAAGASFLRGGAFKPRTSPYAFQGLRAEGWSFFWKRKKKPDFPLLPKLCASTILICSRMMDIIQVGARNMQNFELLKALGIQTSPSA